MSNHFSRFTNLDIYRSILDRHGLVLDTNDYRQLQELIALIFEIDIRYQRAECFPDRVAIANLKETMRSIFPDCPAIYQPAIERFFTAKERETNPSIRTSLERYLHISGDSVGSHLLASQIACFLQIPPEIWLSPTLAILNGEIHRLIRLANDYPDVTLAQSPLRIKASQFFADALTYKRYFFARYYQHQFRYWFTRLYWQYRRNGNDYTRAIHCAQSLLQWADPLSVINTAPSQNCEEVNRYASIGKKICQ
jgi:hypothetical protein